MARKTKIITIDADGRDAGKSFLITEMPASQGEKWAARAFLALAKSGIEVPDNIQDMGLAGIATVGLQAFGGVPWDLAEPLMDEMFRCVARIPDMSKPDVARPLVEDDTEEIGTRVKLRAEVFELHTGFSQAVARFRSTTAAARAAEGVSPST